MSEKMMNAVLALLNEERAALLNGDFVDLDRLAPEKQKMLAGLPSHALSETNMLKVAHAVRRNQSLLAAALDGLRSARGKMSDLREKRSSFLTYDRTGLRKPVGQGAGSIERKA